MTLGYFDFISYSISKIKIWLRIYEYRTWLINRKAKKQKEHMRKARNYRIEKKSEIVLMVKMFRKEIVWVTIETNTFNSFGLVGLKLPKHNDCFFYNQATGTYRKSEHSKYLHVLFPTNRCASSYKIHSSNSWKNMLTVYCPVYSG